MRRPRAILRVMLSIVVFSALPVQATRTLPSIGDSLRAQAPLEFSGHPATDVPSGRSFHFFEEPEKIAGYPQRFPIRFDTAKAAGAPLDCGEDIDGPEECFPGGVDMLFQGLWHDPVTGLAYARNRWYDARTAHWLSPDPMGAVDSPNLYAFVGWAPHMGRDPLGLFGGVEARFRLSLPPEQREAMTQADRDLVKLAGNRHVLSLGAGFIPGVGDIKDFQEALTGWDLVAGEKLGWGERALTGLAAVLPVIPGKAIRKLGRPVENIWNEFQRLTRGVFRGKRSRREAAWAFDEFKAAARAAKTDLREVRIVQGAPDRVAVIGRWMGGRVHPTADYLRGKGWFREVKTFKPRDDAIEQWNRFMKKFPDGVPESEALTSLMYKENLDWIKKMVSEGYTIIDIGEGGARFPSTFYEMEKTVVYGS